MIVLGIVLITPLTHELDEKVAVDAFVVMQRDEIQIVQPEHCRNQQDGDHADLPDTFGNVRYVRRVTTGAAIQRRLVFDRCLLLLCFLTFT